MHSKRNAIRVAVTYRVCQHWRSHIFARLNRHPNLDIHVMHGQSIAGTKLLNGEQLEGFGTTEHFTIRIPFKHDWVFHPFIVLSLFKYKPDVILAEGGSNFLTNFLVILYGKLFRRPVIWWTLGELQGNEKPGFVRQVFRWLVRWQERLCNVYLGYSKVAANYFRKAGFDESKCFIAVNCVDTERVQRAIESRRDEACQLSNELNADARKIVLFAGALTQPKRVDRLLQVYAEIRDDIPETALVIVGDGPCRKQLHSLAQELEIENSVVFAGNRSTDISDFFEAADLFVLPGLGGLAISEAMCHALPVVCTIADGCEVNYVENGITGFRLASTDDGETHAFLADSIKTILQNDEQRKSMSAAAAELIRVKYNVDTYTQNIVDAIEYAYRIKGRRRHEN